MIVWDEKYAIGNATVDAQHKKLFELLGGLVEACNEGRDLAKIQSTLEFLVSYTEQHFRDEEALQISCGYPYASAHRVLHDGFKIEVVKLVDRFVLRGVSADLSNDINKIVVKWLVKHIMQEDKRIVEHIRATGQG